MTTQTYRVTGMTCDHCRMSVEEEVSEIDGVESVAVDVEAGTVTVTGDVGEPSVRAAVEEAGYSMA
ncbi:MAG: cation transporter [Nitriliruptoraceae bacterium]